MASRPRQTSDGLGANIYSEIKQICWFQCGFVNTAHTASKEPPLLLYLHVYLVWRLRFPIVSTTFLTEIHVKTNVARANVHEMLILGRGGRKRHINARVNKEHLIKRITELWNVPNGTN